MALEGHPYSTRAAKMEISVKSLNQDKRSRHHTSAAMSALACLLALMATLGSPVYGVAQTGGSVQQLVATFEPQCEELRLNHLRQAEVWTDIATNTLDLKAGSQESRSFTFNEEVTCKYHTPGRKISGATPKFLCEIDGVSYRVKYLERNDPSSNREVFAETAASRLFWALGFGADLSYPVQIRCQGCPASPHEGPTRQERASGRYKTRTRALGLALIGVRFDGATIECDPGQGWKWQELDEYVGTYIPSEPRSDERDVELMEVRKHVEALKLLQVFVQHGDCKAKQQRLICLPGGIILDEPNITTDEDEESIAGRASCRQSYAIVDDLGATFGGAGNFTKSSAKMSLKHWVAKPVFDLEHYHRTNGQCKGVLNTSTACGGGIENPIITETGRQFLLERLRSLSDSQIRDIFIAARVEMLYTNDDEGQVDEWARVFKDKVQQIATHPCREH